MGNIVSGNDNYLKDTELKRIILDWARNDYDAGLSYGQADYKLKNILQKRACCTRNNNMIIALPNVDIQNIDEPIKDGYYPVYINAFDNDKDINSTNCMFVNESTPNNSQEQLYYQTEITKVGHSAIPACTTLYTSGSSNLNLCGSIKEERRLTYNNDISQTAYGYYAIRPDAIKTLNSYNNYTDCNCQNSILKDMSNIVQKVGAPNVGLPETLAQSNDSYCTDCLTAGKCYIPSYQRISSLCINMSSITDAVAENNSNIINNQECSTNTDTGSGQNITTLNFLSQFFNKNITIISVVIVIIVAMIIGAVIIF